MDDPNRREFLERLLATTVAGTIAPQIARADATAAAPTVPVPRATIRAEIPVALDVNGRTARLSLDPRTTLLDALRESMHLTGSKKGCDHGQCGACTVHVNGRRVLSCLTLAAMVQGEKITTIEGLAQGETLHPVQQSFIDHDAFQCGYCTPGQVMSATALLNEPCGPADDDIRECMSGNICRCGAYPQIVAAVQALRANAAR